MSTTANASNATNQDTLSVGSKKRALNSSFTEIPRSSTARTSLSDISRARTWTSRSSISQLYDYNRLRGIHGAKGDLTVTGIIRPRFAKKEDSEVYSIKFSPDEEFFACGLGNSKVKVYSIRSNTQVNSLENPLQNPVPATSVAFRPNHSSFKTKSVLAVAYADGKIRHWHYTSGKLLSTIEEPDNDINYIGYRKDGLYFLTAGSDATVRIYDTVTSKSTHSLKYGTELKTSGHSNRIFSAKFHPKDSNAVLSAGWDNTVQIWDLRASKSVASIYGPHICGDSLDLNDDGSHILTGSHRSENPLQVWDWRTRKLIDSICWSGAEGEMRTSSLLYSASYSRGTESLAGPCHNRFIIAGGCNSNEMRIFTADSHRAVGSILGLADAIYTIDMSPTDRYVALGGGGQGVLVFNVEEKTHE